MYGKISKVTKTNGTVITYTYDVAGNRISKKVTGTGASETWYVRDASGNVMSTYNMATSGGVTYATWSEADVYGSSRVATYRPKFNMLDGRPPLVNMPKIGDIAYYYNFSRGLKLFELTNHLGNVLATVTDTKIPVNNGNTISYYIANLVNATEYAPFGMRLRGRDSTLQTYNTAYRFGFNGKEQDKSITSQDYDYGMRIYDARVGKFLSVDPLRAKFPYYSPYQFSGNSPIKFIDLDGGEPKNSDNKELKGKEYKMYAANLAYSLTGGDDKYWQSPETESLVEKVNSVDKSKFIGNNVNDKMGRFVNTTSQSILKDENAFKTENDLVNQLLGDFFWGNGPENILFPENGKFSTALKSSVAVGESLAKWKKAGYKSDIYSWGMDGRGEINVDVNSGFTGLEHFLGSVSVKISNVNEQMIKVEIFNITSLTSADFDKDIPLLNLTYDALRSTPRNSNQSSQTDHTNQSQYFSFTMSKSEAEKLINRYNPNGNEGNSEK